MHTVFFRLFLALSLFFVSGAFVSAEETEKGFIDLKAEIDASKVYEGQPVSLIVRVYSSTPDVKYIDLAQSVELGEKLHRMTVDVERSSDGRWEKTSYKGRQCFSAVVFRTVLLPVQKGTVSIPPMKFKVGVVQRKVVNDLFWGPLERNIVNDEMLSTEKISFKINALPKINEGFSGAVGNFKLDAILPPGDIEPEQDIIVVYRVSGQGSLVSAVIPDIIDYLPKGITFKSEAQSESASLRNGKLHSSMEVEFTVHVGEKGEYTIPPLSMVCFDPDSGKYVKIQSEPLTIKVGNARNRKISPSQIYQI